MRFKTYQSTTGHNLSLQVDLNFPLVYSTYKVLNSLTYGGVIRLLSSVPEKASSYYQNLKLASEIYVFKTISCIKRIFVYFIGFFLKRI